MQEASVPPGVLCPWDLVLPHLVGQHLLLLWVWCEAVGGTLPIGALARALWKSKYQLPMTPTYLIGIEPGVIVNARQALYTHPAFKNCGKSHATRIDRFNHSQVCSSAVFNIFTLLLLNILPEEFLPATLKLNSPSPLLSLWQPVLYFLFLWIWLL